MDDDDAPAGQDFRDVDLRGARFEGVDLRGATFRTVDLSGATFTGVELGDVTITGELERVTVNGVDIAPLVEAELDRRDPERPLMRPVDAEGFRRALAVLERRWGETIARAAALPPAALHTRVEGEWSFTETLRHVAFALDVWVARAIQGDPAPWDPLELPWEQAPPLPGVTVDRAARPSLAEAVALFDSRVARVREELAGLTDARLDAQVTPPGPGWPPPVPHAVRACLRVVLTEMWEHRAYAERDLAALPAGPPPPSTGADSAG